MRDDNSRRRRKRLSADDVDGLIEATDDDKVRRFWQTIKEEKLRNGTLAENSPERKKFLTIPLYDNFIAVVFILAILAFSAWFLFRYTGIRPPIDITQPVLVVVFAFSAIMFYRYVSDKEEIVNMLDEVAGYSIQNESVFENIGSALVVVDIEGKVTKINRKAGDILEAVNYELKGRSCQTLAVNQGIATILLQTLRTGRPAVNDEIEWASSKGRHYSLQVTTSLLQNKKRQIVGAVAVINDITEVRDLQEKLKLNEHLASIGELSAKLGHEVGNSLGGIKLFTDNLIDEFSVDDHRREYAEEILAEVERLNTKVSKLKSYSRPISLDLKKADVNEIMSEVISFAMNKIQENNISVDKQLVPYLPEVMLDRDQIRGALLNIIINAIQAMPHGGEISVSSQHWNGTVELSIADTGMGIPEDIRGKIFNPFFTTKKMLGTGLGLSIVYKAIQAHGGTIRCDSELDKGTTFTIGLPVDATANEQRISGQYDKEQYADVLSRY